MNIKYTNTNPIYYDMNGNEIHEGNHVFMNGRSRKVYRTEEGYLGIDSTNPAWIESGKAVEGEFGIYPFTEEDTPILIKEVE